MSRLFVSLLLVVTIFSTTYAGEVKFKPKSPELQAANQLYLQNKYDEALTAYRKIMDSTKDTYVLRQSSSMLAEVLIYKASQTDSPSDREKYLKEAVYICNKVRLIGDIWFGKAVVMLAHACLIQGDRDGANSMIEKHKHLFKELDTELHDKRKLEEDLIQLSPMAESRYILAVLMQEEAGKLLSEGKDKEKAKELLIGQETPTGKRTTGALQHFVNINVRYAKCPWAEDSGKRADQIKKILTDNFGAMQIQVKK